MNRRERERARASRTQSAGDVEELERLVLQGKMKHLPKEKVISDSITSKDVDMGSADAKDVDLDMLGNGSATCREALADPSSSSPTATITLPGWSPVLDSDYVEKSTRYHARWLYFLNSTGR